MVNVDRSVAVYLLQNQGEVFEGGLLGAVYLY